MKEDMEDKGKEKTKTGKSKTKWKENGLDEKCKEERKMGEGREREKKRLIIRLHELPKLIQPCCTSGMRLF